MSTVFIMGGLGTVIGYFLTLTFLPSLLIVLPEPWVLRASQRRQWRWPGWLSGFLTRHYQAALLVIMAVLPLPALVGFARLEIDDHFARLFNKSTWFRDDADFIESKLAGVTTIDFSLSAGRPGGIADPRFLHTVEEVQQHLAADPMVARVAGFTDTLKRINRAVHNADQAYYRLPDDSDSAGQLSNFFVNVTLGLLTALVFSVGLIWDLLMTPSLLLLLHPHVKASGRQPAVPASASLLQGAQHE